MAKMPYILPESSHEVLYGVIQDDAGHGDTSQGIGHIDSGVGEIAGLIHKIILILFDKFAHQTEDGLVTVEAHGLIGVEDGVVILEGVALLVL